MYNGEIIKDLLREQGKLAKDLLLALDVKSNGSLSQLIKNANPTAERLEKIADFLDIPIDTLFIRERQYDIEEVNHGKELANVSVRTLKNKVRDQQIIIEEKDKRIALLEEMVSMLRRQIEEKSS